MKWIAETYGEQAIRAMIDDYGRQIIPFAINRSIRRATGRTFEELYPAWIESLRRAFAEQADAIRARGLREGIRLTHTGYTLGRPRWIPANAWPERAGDLSFYVDDGHTTAGVWALPLARTPDGRIVGGREDRRELVIRTNGVTGASFLPDGTAVFSSGDIYNNLFLFDDLFELPSHEKSPSGLEGNRVRWSEGWRAVDPSVSPDGRRVAFTTNHRGTTYLMMADIVPSPQGTGHALANVRPLVRSGRFDQAFTPRWSPDNRHVAYSSWVRGGYRDIRIVDTADGSWVDVTHDRSIDGDPVYSPDGQHLYFHSDRTGVMNVYAYDVGTGRLRQVTNVINGAYQPEPSPDGKWLAYVGYTHQGYDLFVLPLDESQWLEPLPYEETRPAPPAEPEPARVTPKPYDPWPTLAARKYSLQITPGNFGQATTLTAVGGDIAGIHAIAASLTTEWEHPEVEGSVGYSYGRLPFDVAVSLFRQIAPAGNYRLGGNVVTWIQETAGLTTDLFYSMPRAFDSQSFDISYSVARYAGEVPFPVAQLNPYDTPSIPTRGTLGTLHMGWGYSNAQGYTYSVGNEKGYSLSATFDLADQALASDFSGFAATFNLATYQLMPWFRHHALALHASCGMSGGDRAGHGPFYVGGFVDLPVVNVVQNVLIQGGLALRGYPVVAEVGSYYALFDAEYRFPIVNVDRGPSTLPLFLNRISGAAFVDYGSAFDNAATAEFKTGVGGELWFDLTLGYLLGFTFRAGYAKGLASGGIDKTYFVASVPF
jgi:Tol biopolymer transport system component